MPSNEEILQKADLTLSDLQGSGKGGLLQAEQSNTFIRKLIKSPTMINAVRVKTMNSPQMKINKIGFGKRILRKATSGTALDTAAQDGAFDANAEATARAKPTTEQVELNTKEVMAEVRIPYDVMEDNIEQATAANNETHNSGPGGLRNTIISLIAERAALDLEELALLGDTNSSDGYLAMFDGWLKLAEDNGNVVDNQGATISKDMFKQGLKTMPDQYLRQRSALRNYVSVNNEIEYRDTLANRGTALGDSVIQNDRGVPAYGASVLPVPMMPEAKGIFTNPLNCIMGIQRQISMEYEKDISARVYTIVLTARVAFQIEETEAAVLYKNIG